MANHINPKALKKALKECSTTTEEVQWYPETGNYALITRFAGGMIHSERITPEEAAEFWSKRGF